MYVYLIFILFFFSSCSESTLEDYRESGRSNTKTLIKKLEKVHTIQDLILQEKSLENLFFNLSELMVKARQNHQELLPLEKEDLILSDKLRNELNRIFLIPGGKKILESCQEKALTHLSIFEKQIEKKNKPDMEKKL